MTRSSHHPTTSTRRQFLAAGGTAALASVAGCANVVNSIADQFLEDVNVFNETDRRVTGTIQVTDPAGGTALDETFDLAASDDSGDDDGPATVFENVWAETGSYGLRVELENTDIEGQSRATETVAVSDPDEEMVGIPLGADDLDEPIAFRVGEELTDWHEA